MASALPILKCIANVEAIGSDIRIGSANAIGSVDDCSNQLLLPKSRLCDGGSTNPYRFKVLRPHHSDTSMHSVTLLFAGQVEELLRGLQVDGYVRQPNAFGFGPELLAQHSFHPDRQEGPLGERSQRQTSAGGKATLARSALHKDLATIQFGCRRHHYRN